MNRGFGKIWNFEKNWTLEILKIRKISNSEILEICNNWQFGKISNLGSLTIQGFGKFHNLKKNDNLGNFTI